MTDTPPGRLREIASRYGAASTSPWRWGDDGLEHSGPMQYLVLALPHAHVTQSRGADLDLIENAPTDIAYLLNLVAQLELDLSVAERNLSEVTESAVQPLRQPPADATPDRIAKLEAALEVVAAREALNSAAQRQVEALVTLAHDGWGIIAAAENFKYQLVGGHYSEPIGPQDWRNAATEWRDRFHVLVGTLPAEHAPAPIDPHAMCAHETVKLRGERDRLADEIERLRGIVRSMEADHAAQQASWQPQINELTIERDAASRQLAACRNAQTELERQLHEANEELHVLRSSDTLEAVAAHAGLRNLVMRFEVDGGGMHAYARVPVADLNTWKIVVGDQDTKRSTKRIVATTPSLMADAGIAAMCAPTPAPQAPAGKVGPRGCRGYAEADEGRFVYCDQEWPHLRVTDPDNDTGDLYDHCNVTWGVYFNQQRGELPPQAPWQGPGWTLGHVRQFVAAYPDWSDDAEVTAIVPERPREWAYDGSGLYCPPFLTALKVDDPRDFL